MEAIPVYAVNLRRRVDRRVHILEQFSEKPEFDFRLVSAVEHPRGASGLWMTLRQIVRSEIENRSSYFIFCEDDHLFTEHYTPERLHTAIDEARTLGADLLSGGFSWFENAVQVSDRLFWVDCFTGMQFTVIFNTFYHAILEADFGETVITDRSLSGITDNKFVIYPYISRQKEFGYSDVTDKNNETGYVDDIFDCAIERLRMLEKVRKFYNNR